MTVTLNDLKEMLQDDPHVDNATTIENIVEYAEDTYFSGDYEPILIPSDANNDVNGSAHHPYDVHFTYRDATEEEILEASSIGTHSFAEAMFATDDEQYTGHGYDGVGEYFYALVVDPPKYAQERSI